jgi:hypothetical protein
VLCGGSRGGWGGWVGKKGKIEEDKRLKNGSEDELKSSRYTGKVFLPN